MFAMAFAVHARGTQAACHDKHSSPTRSLAHGVSKLRVSAGFGSLEVQTQEPLNYAGAAPAAA